MKTHSLNFGHSDWRISAERVSFDAYPPPYTSAREFDTKGDSIIEQTIDNALDQLAPDLYNLSMNIHGLHNHMIFSPLSPNIVADHPEIKFQER